jgi:hypothetical protein
MTLSQTSAPAGAAPASTPRTGRRAVLRSVARSLLTTTALVYLYFEVPFTGSPSVTGAGLLVLGLLAFTGLVTWQVLSVTRSDQPRLRAVEVLATAAPFLLLLFSASYFLMARHDPHAFSQPLDRMDALYFTVTVFATVGFGDITATATDTRIAVTIQMLCDLIVIGVGVRLLFSAVQLGLSRRRGEGEPEATNGITRSG